MKINLSLLFLLSLALPSTAQDPAGEKIRQELNAHPQQDTFRVNRLNEMIFYSRDESYYKEALAISLKIGYAKGEGYALIQSGFTKSRQGHRPEGDSMYRRADSIARENNNLDLLATVQVYQAYSTCLVNPELGRTLLLKAEKSCEKTGNKKLLSICQYFIGVEYANAQSNFPKGIEYYLKSVQSAEEVNYLRYIGAGNIALGRIYRRMDDKENTALYFQKAREVNKRLKNPGIESQLLVNEGNDYREAGRFSGAADAYKAALELSKGADSVLIVSTQADLADAYIGLDSLPLAFNYGFRSARFAKRVGDYLLFSEIAVTLSKAYLKNAMPDSAVYYAKLGYDSSKRIGATEVMRDNAQALANAYAYKKDFANAYLWHLLYFHYSDSVLTTEVRNKSAVLKYNADLEKKQAQITMLNQQKKVQQNFLYSVLAVLLLILVIAFMLLRNNRLKQKANKLLQKQKLEIVDQRDQTNKALKNLQQTQSQLIQSEKMASLGELTAGIAHEIQNPLNFINNFSEVNKELLAELKEEIQKGNLEEAKTISDDVIGNEEKISHHGKRADSIVKGMLQHSRESKGKKEPTDINALADEYLRLAYHGLRSKDNSFNATMHTDYDKSIGKINIIPQDIGRVLLNLYNNAFYAVAEKAKTSGGDYKPTITVVTCQIPPPGGQRGAFIEIAVSDNGPGIPQKILDKIFQPFFTTKPTGQGTGLGLSLSYDIVKAHGGEIKVESKEGDGTEFMISLPII